MARGKVAHTDPPVKWRINVPQSVAAKVELMLFDPLKGEIKYGARSDLITKLLVEWLGKVTGGSHDTK